MPNEFYIVPEAALDATADAIREKTGSQASIEFTQDGFADAIEDIPSESTDPLWGNGTYEYKNDNITAAHNNPFAAWPVNGNLKISLPNCLSWEKAFNMINPGQTVLTRLNLPKLQSCPNSFIRRQGGLTAIYLPAVTSITQESLKELWGINKDLVLPSLTNAQSVQQFISLGTSNGGITVNIYMPALTTFSFNNSFQDCKFTKIIDFGSAAGNIGNAVFKNCYILDTIIFRKSDGIVNLTTDGATAFENSPFNGYNNLTGTVYCPSALIDTYKSATNWSTLYNNGTVSFSAIEGSQYENLDYVALAAPAKAVQEDWL